MADIESKQQTRKLGFKSRNAADEARAKRTDKVSTIRKVDRTQEMRKRRREMDDDDDDISDGWNMSDSAARGGLKSTTAPAPTSVSGLVRQIVSDTQQSVRGDIAARQARIVSLLPELNSLLDTIRANVCGFDQMQAQILPVVREIRRILAMANGQIYVNDVVSNGGVAMLATLLTPSASPELLVEVLWCITNVASSTTEHVDELGKYQIPAILMQILRQYTDWKVIENCFYALSNIFGDSARWRDVLMQQQYDFLNVAVGIWQRVQLHLKNHPDDVEVVPLWRLLPWGISNAFRNQPYAPLVQIQVAIAPLMEMALHSHDDRCRFSAIRGMADMTPHGDEILDYLRQFPVLLRHMVKQLSSGHPTVRKDALKFLGAFAAGTTEQTDSLVQVGCISTLHAMIRGEPTNSLKVKAIWTLSNVACGPVEHLQQIIDQACVPTLIEICNDRSVFALKREACFTLCNMVNSANEQQLYYLGQQHTAAAISSLLGATDVDLLILILNSLQILLALGEMQKHLFHNENIVCVEMENVGALDKLERLQEHENKTLYELVVHLIQVYFGDEDAAELAPFIIGGAGDSHLMYPSSNWSGPTTTTDSVHISCNPLVSQCPRDDTMNESMNE